MPTAFHLAGFVVASFLVMPATTGAAERAEEQQTDQQARQTTAAPQARSADFLFGRPKRSVGIRGNWLFASAGSDLFDFVTRHLTLEKEHFNSPGFAADVAFALTPRALVEAGVEVNRMARGSEYRDFVDNDLLPIEQRTSLQTTYVGAGIRYALTPRGDEVSRLAWIPRRVVPFVGAGAGAMFYQFRQSGDFVDFVDLSVFRDSFRSQGWAPTAQVFGGVDLQIYRGLYATVQGRYTKAAGELSSDFIEFDPIDLSGFRLSAGINVLF
ncbi:MAG TPA: hypothetical protein VMO26_00380 [Vicinamibacterales bacterium]|nr:hypothetical protein [Vicinamibacterales bacterium]